MIFKYSYDLEEKFKNIKAGFYNMREINVKKRELSRSHTLAFIGRYEQDVKDGYLKSLGELRELIAAKKHLFLKSHNAKRYTVTDVPPGKYIWIAYSLESKECWWGAPTKVHRKNVLYTLD